VAQDFLSRGLASYPFKIFQARKLINDQAMTRWLLLMDPINMRQRWKVLHHGSRSGGLPVEGVGQLFQSRNFRNRG
jgi:hypothetical protein